MGAATRGRFGRGPMQHMQPRAGRARQRGTHDAELGLTLHLEVIGIVTLHGVLGRPGIAGNPLVP